MRTKEKKPSPDYLDRLKDRVRQVYEWDILCREADALNPIDKQTLTSLLAEQNLHLSDNTLRDDMDALNLLDGHRIGETMVDHIRGFYPLNRPLEAFELRIILDALQANPVLSTKEQKDLKDKLLSLASRKQAHDIEKELSVTGIRSRNDSSLIPNLKALNIGCQKGTHVTFHYFYLDEERRHVPQGDGKYEVEPVGLVYRSSRYYLVGWDCRKRLLAHFRVDRMERVENTGRKNKKAVDITNADLEAYISQTLNMFQGRETDIDLLLHDLKAIGILFDRFGEDVKVTSLSENEWEAYVTVQKSPELWGWLCGKSGLMTLAGPKDAVEDYTGWLRQALNETEQGSQDDK